MVHVMAVNGYVHIIPRELYAHSLAYLVPPR